MSKFIDLTRKRFDRLLVLRKATDKEIGDRYMPRIYWVCQCDCGNTTVCSSLGLRTKRVKSCGCLQRENTSKASLIDLTGKRFGKLLVIRRATKEETKDKKLSQKIVYWLCKCDCGNEKIANGSNLRTGELKSCGCLHKEFMKKLHKDKEINLLGQQFGQLTVINKAPRKYSINNPNGNISWECLCSCGNISIVSTNNLRTNAVTSCGKCKMSRGEFKIKKILDENNISYIREYAVIKGKNNNFLKFDFFVDNKYVIEYDGKQHFESIGFFGGDERLKETQEKDKIKNVYCFNNNIDIIRIPFTHYKDININDLKPNTSKFLLKGV